MPMPFLKKLSTKKGHIYISDPIEIGWVIDLKYSGFIDAEVGPFSKDEAPSMPPRFAIVRGLTQDGWEELELLDAQQPVPVSGWGQLVSFTKRNFPLFKPRAIDSGFSSSH